MVIPSAAVLRIALAGYACQQLPTLSMGMQVQVVLMGIFTIVMVAALVGIAVIDVRTRLIDSTLLHIFLGCFIAMMLCESGHETADIALELGRQSWACELAMPWWLALIKMALCSGCAVAYLVFTSRLVRLVGWMDMRMRAAKYKRQYQGKCRYQDASEKANLTGRVDVCTEPNCEMNTSAQLDVGIGMCVEPKAVVDASAQINEGGEVFTELYHPVRQAVKDQRSASKIATLPPMLGMGDVRLFAVCALYLGWLVFVQMIVASLLALIFRSIYSAYLCCQMREQHHDGVCLGFKSIFFEPFAFGPYIVSAFLLVIGGVLVR